ncbi:hypothetical protein [Thiocapsa sp.]|nr:hypothetical protein [Thiocapsa sp.]
MKQQRLISLMVKPSQSAIAIALSANAHRPVRPLQVSEQLPEPQRAT